jgi:hypothetical protein
MMKYIISGILLVSLIGCRSLSQENPESKDWHAHIQEGENNYQMKMKASEAVNALKKRTEDLIAAHQQHLDEQADALLRAEQNQWEVWAKSRASLISDTYRGGTHESLAYGYELVDLYLRRIDQLKQLEEDLKP